MASTEQGLTASFSRLMGHRRSKSNLSQRGYSTSEFQEAALAMALQAKERGRSWLPSVNRKAVPSPLNLRHNNTSSHTFSLSISRPQIMTPDHIRKGSDNDSIRSFESASSKYSICEEPSSYFGVPTAVPPRRPARPETALYETEEEAILLKSPMASVIGSPHKRVGSASSDYSRPPSVSPEMRSAPNSIDDIISNRYETLQPGSPPYISKRNSSVAVPPPPPIPASTASPTVSRRPSTKKKSKVSIRIGRSTTQRSTGSRKKSKSQRKKGSAAMKLKEKVNWPKRLASKRIGSIAEQESKADDEQESRPNSIITAHQHYLETDAQWSRESLFLETGRWPLEARLSPMPSPATGRSTPQDPFHLDELYPRSGLANVSNAADLVSPTEEKEDNDATPVAAPVTAPIAAPIARKPVNTITAVLEPEVRPTTPAKEEDGSTTPASTPPQPPSKNPARFAGRLNMTQLPTIPENIFSPNSAKPGTFAKAAATTGLQKVGPHRSGTVRPAVNMHMIPRKKIGQAPDVNWADFQFAIMCGAGDLVSGMAEDEARDFADDMADWFDTFGFDSHGELVPDVLETLACIPLMNVSSAGESDASSILSVEDVDFPIPVSTLFEDHIAGALARRGSTSEDEADTANSGAPGLVSEKLTVTRHLSSRFQTQGRARSVSPVESIEPPQTSPMSCNMNNDLEQFLEWNPSGMYSMASYESPDDIGAEDPW